jgi:hypothetical protein
MRLSIASAVVVSAMTAACARPPAISITAPGGGAELDGPAVTITLAAERVTIAPVAENQPGAAHAHLFLDVPVSRPDSAIPFGVAGVVHLGGGQMEHRFDSVAPGLHRVIAVLADNAHVPVPGVRSDTVDFVVRVPSP